MEAEREGNEIDSKTCWSH